MDNFPLTEQNVAIIIQALCFFSDINNNKYLTEEQYEMAQDAIATIEDHY